MSGLLIIKVVKSLRQMSFEFFKCSFFLMTHEFYAYKCHDNYLFMSKLKFIVIRYFKII
jgi:hypothetical protein